MMSKALISSAVVVLAACLSACAPEQHKHIHVKHNSLVKEYREHRKDDAGDISYIYWYILYDGNSTYYYRSETPVVYTNLSTTPFTRSPGAGLPKEVQDEVEQSEPVNDIALDAEIEPTVVADTDTSVQEDAMTNEGGPSTSESTSESSSSSSSSTSESSSSSDSSSASSDSGGGGDGGGGSSE